MSNQHEELEEGSRLAIDFNKLIKVAQCGQPVVPAVVQDVDSKDVLITGYVNREALEYALEHKMATFWSTSRNELWIKGATSGDYLELIETRVNCEQNSILYIVRLKGQGTCHTKKPDGTARLGCYYRRITDAGTLEKLPE